MAAPSSTVWGNIATGSKTTRKGKIGIYTGVTTSETQVKVTVQVWFWSMYSVEDVNNSYYYDAASSATTLVGSVSINHTVATGDGWSTSNQTKLGESSYTYSKGTSATTKYYAAKLTGIDSVGSSNVMSVSTSVSVPALTSYTVKYNANNGSGAPSSQTKWYGKSLTLSSTKPTRTGYSFQGWATSASGSVAYAAGASYTANASVTLYAVWKANTYTVSYNANGGSGAPSSQTKTYDVALTLSSTKPTRTNYNFIGWGTSASATSATYSAGGTYTTNASATLYAVWSLAYTKPRISGLSADRCDSAGAINDSGTYALVKCSWATDQDVESITIDYKLTSETDWTTACTLASSNLSGDISQIIGDGSFNEDRTYDIRVVVTDANGSSTKPTVLPGVNYIIDILAEGKGIAFNKPAELENVADMNFQLRTMAGYLQPLLENGTDFDSLMIPNTYTLKTAKSAGYSNSPITSGTGVLTIQTSGDEGQVRQIVTKCHKTNPERYERYYYEESWGDWVCTFTV